MASKAKNSRAEDEPLIDLNDSAIKKLIAQAKKRGYLTIDELNEALPQDQNEQIEDVMSAISEMGVRIVENDEEAAEEMGGDEVESIDGKDKDKKTAAAAPKKAAADRTDDPVRMYLREMGAVELLSREGEIAIAKRIEAGRDTMIWGLCESPTTFNAIIEWSTALNDGEMQLREILDLDAMLSKDPVPENLEDGDDDDGEISEKTAGPSFKDDDEVEDAEPADGEDDDEAELTERRTKRVVEEEEEDNTLSLAQMEETLKPGALEKFALITSVFKKFSKLQTTRLESLAAGKDFPAASEKKYHDLREELTALVESVQFHANKIEFLVDQLYSFNRRLTTLGGQMLRLAERHKVPRRAFLESYVGNELDDNWLASMAKTDKKWAAFVEKEADAVDRIRSEISDASSTWCKRANAKHASPKRKWWKQTFAW